MHEFDLLNHELEHFFALDASALAACAARCAALAEANDAQRGAALRALALAAAQHPYQRPRESANSTPQVQAALEQVMLAVTRAPISPSLVESAVAAYRGLSPINRARRQLLLALAAGEHPEAVAAFADLLADDPPTDSADVDGACVPLFRRAQLPVASLFPRLLDALQHPSAAAAVLDLANHLARRGMTARHPAADRAQQLTQLLGGVVDRLRRLEERPDEFAASPAELRKIVTDGLPLVIGLCDALGLIGDDRAVGKLHQAMELSHRRLRIEAAAALARLGQDRGRDTLLELAAQPVARNRALAYLSELGQLERVPEALRTAAAAAEGAFAEWLAAPTQFGLAPHELLLVDHCRQRWPGHAEPVDCYLFDYEYHLPHGELSSVGIAGPITHCFAADLSDLPPADIYAAYAGWCAEHDDIVQTASADLSPEDVFRFERLADGWQSQGIGDARLVLRGMFFGEEHWVATVRRGGAAGVVVIDGEQTHWFPTVAASRPPGPEEAYNIIKGRKLLRVFNA